MSISILHVNTGTSPNAGNGDNLRLAFDKVNQNFNSIVNYISSSTTSTTVILPQDLATTASPTFAALTLTTSTDSTPTIQIGSMIGPTFPYTGLNADYNVDAYTQVMMQNHSASANATSDVIIPNDQGDQTVNMIDLGINSSQYSQSGFDLQTPGSGYLFTNGVDLFIGTQTPGTRLVFHAGGTSVNDAGGVLDDYAWRFNRSVQVTVPTPGPLNFTVRNTSNDAAATSIFQAMNELGSSVMLGITSSNYTEGNIGVNQAFLHTETSENTLHIGNKSELRLYADADQGFNGTATITLVNNDNYEAKFAGCICPLNNVQQTVGSSTSTWKTVHTDAIVGQTDVAIGAQVTNVTMFSGAGANLYVWVGAEAATPEVVQLITYGDLTGWTVTYPNNVHPGVTITSMAGAGLYFNTDGPLAYDTGTTLIFTSPGYTPEVLYPVNVLAGLKFPDTTIQTTAYTGSYTPTTPANWTGSPTVGTIVSGLDELASRVTTLSNNAFHLTAAPTSSKGKAGDVTGMLSANTSSIFYCVANYTPLPNSATVDIVGGNGVDNGIAVTVGVVPQVGWTIEFNGQSSIINQVVPQSTWYVVFWNDRITINTGNTFTYGPGPLANIWVKQDWGNTGNW